MKDKNILDYKINGVSKRKEILIALPLGLLVLIIGAGLLYAYVKFTGINSRQLGPGLIIPAAALSSSITFSIFALFGRAFLKDYWIIQLNTKEKTLLLKYGQKEYHLKLNEILKIDYMGQASFRYLTFHTANEKVALRVGSSQMIPFSTPEDLEKIDHFFLVLDPFIKKNFNKMVLKNKLPDFNPFYGFGRYVNKSEKIKYRLINRLSPNYILIGMTLMGFIFLLLLVSIVEFLADGYISIFKLGLPFTVILFIIYCIVVYFHLKKEEKK